MRSIVNISMPEGMIKLIEEGVAEGGYASKSEFFRMLLKQWVKKKMRRSSNSPTGIRVRGSKR